MLKLLLCLVCALAVALAMLQLRQQELEFKHQAADLQKQIESRQGKLWNQQLQIAIHTAPNALTHTIGSDIELVPETNLPGNVGNWLAAGTPDGQ